jgi:hypothetical protein
MEHLLDNLLNFNKLKHLDMKRILYLLAIISVFIFFACETVEEPEKEYSTAYPVCGEWAVNMTDATGAVQAGPYRVKTYNSSFSKDSIWIDDVGTGLKGKAKLDLPNKTFATNNPVEMPYWNDTTTTISGKIINTDSIYITIQFKGEPGVDYIISGHRIVSYEDYQNSWQ